MNSNGENSQKSYKNKISMELEESRNNIQKCKSCDMSFDHRTKLKGHIRKFHNQKSLRCNSCENLFLCPAELRRHRETVHEKLKDHKCDSCGKSFSRAFHLKTHIHTVHVYRMYQIIYYKSRKEIQ